MEYNIGDSSVKLAGTIGKIRTYIDLMNTIAEYLKNQNWRTSGLATFSREIRSKTANLMFTCVYGI